MGLSQYEETILISYRTRGADPELNDSNRCYQKINWFNCCQIDGRTILIHMSSRDHMVPSFNNVKNLHHLH